MNCREIQELKHAYADGELDLLRSLEIEQHLNGCGACSHAYQNVNELSGVLKTAGLYFTAPADLKERVRASLRAQMPAAAYGQLTSSSLPSPRRRFAEPTERRPWYSRPWLNLAIPAAAIAVIALLLIPALTWTSAENRLAMEVTSSHVRSLMANHLTDVASSDQHTVKPWFDGKVDFAPAVIDLAERGFPLVGGRLDYLENRSVAALVYQRNKHFINLFIWPVANENAKPEKILARQGYNLIRWNESGMAYWAVSDLNRGELRDFAALIKAQAIPAALP
jgi:anti-sigma factor RsiW